jgi:hypothetical protein
MPAVSTRIAPCDGAREFAHRSVRFGAAASTIEPLGVGCMGWLKRAVRAAIGAFCQIWRATFGLDGRLNWCAPAATERAARSIRRRHPPGPTSPATARATGLPTSSHRLLFASVVDWDVVLTASHCLSRYALEDLTIVTGSTTGDAVVSVGASGASTKAALGATARARKCCDSWASQVSSARFGGLPP